MHSCPTCLNIKKILLEFLQTFLLKKYLNAETNNDNDIYTCILTQILCWKVVNIKPYTLDKIILTYLVNAKSDTYILSLT